MTGFSGRKLAIAVDDGTSNDEGPLYGWLNMTTIDDASVPLARDGDPYTTAA